MASVSLERENANLRRILEVSRRMAVVEDLDALLHLIVEVACDVLDCERATIFLYDAANDALYSRVARGSETIRFPADRGIAGAAARQRRCINVPDAYADQRFNREIDKQTGFRTRNLLTFPLENLEGKLIGVLQALNKRDGAFRDADEHLALVLSAQAGVALDRGRLLEEFVEKQRMARDLDIAREIQQGLFPPANPVLPGYDVSGWNRPADETGGDCFDFIELDDGRLVILMADATGHGIGPALIVAECRSLVRALFTATDDLARIAAGVNRLLCDDLADDRFVTAFLGLLDPQRHRIDYVAAGQGPILHLDETGSLTSRSAGMVPFGVLDDVDIVVESFSLAPGAMLALLTDGFFEAENGRDELFGEERIAELLRAAAQSPMADVIGGIYHSVRAFRGPQSAQMDDLTAVLIRRNA